MNRGSAHHHHYLIKKEKHKRDIRCITDVVTFYGDDLIPDSNHIISPSLFKVCQFDKKEHEKVVILKLSIIYSQNDFKEHAQLRVKHLFGDKEAEGGKHPDSTGTLLVSVPGGWCGPIGKDARLLYEPNFVNLGVRLHAYAGLEDSIMNPRSTGISREGITSDWELLSFGDPLLSFLFEQRHMFVETREDDIKLVSDGTTKKPVYAVRKTMLNRVREFFTNSVFSRFQYLEQRNWIQLEWEKKPKQETKLHDRSVVTIVLQMEILVVSSAYVPTKPIELKLNM